MIVFYICRITDYYQVDQEIIRYPVRHPLLRNYIKFFWEIHAGHLELHHKLVPQRNINLRFNLNETPHYLCTNSGLQVLEDVYFLGLQDHFMNAHLKMNGKADVIGICFLPDGFYPFLNIPVSEVKNRVLGASEAGIKPINIISAKLKNAPNVLERLNILENELVSILLKGNQTPEEFRQIFNALKQNKNPLQLTRYAENINVSLRKLERMYNKYVGVSANTYSTLNRFHNSLNQLLFTGYSKLTDLAYENGYFDQMHFIREFKRFAGETPKNFANQKESLLQVGKLK